MSYGLLGLTPEALWHISLGQLLDLCSAYKYKQFIERQEAAIKASYLAAFMGGKINNIEELTGEFINGRVMTIDEANEYRLKKIKRGEN